MKKNLNQAFLFFAALFAPGAPLWACTVCFGGSGSDWSQGFFWGILFLLLLPFVLIGSFFAWIAYSIRRNRRSALPSS